MISPTLRKKRSLLRNRNELRIAVQPRERARQSIRKYQDYLSIGSSTRRLTVKIKNIAFVGIPVTDMKRAREFYEGVLGLKTSDEMRHGKWIEYAIGDDTLAIGRVRSEERR